VKETVEGGDREDVPPPNVIYSSENEPHLFRMTSFLALCTLLEIPSFRNCPKKTRKCT